MTVKDLPAEASDSTIQARTADERQKLERAVADEFTDWPWADRGQPAAETDPCVSGTPTLFASTYQRRSNSSSSSFRIQSQNVLNVNSSGRSRPPRRGRATTAHRNTSHRFSSSAATSMIANRTTGSRVVVIPRACRSNR